jgi:phage-related protein (TIGR01555 family)
VDYSLLHLCKKALRDYDSLVSSVGNMVTDASTPVLKITGFHEALTSSMTSVIKARVALVDMLKWVGRVMPVDAKDEDYQIQDRTFTGLPEVWDRGELRLCACSRYPATLLFGRSPAGMNATGDSDIRLYYDTVSWFREHYLGPELDRLVKILAARLGLADPESWFVSWPSLWQRNPTEEAAHRKAVAEADAIMISNGVVTEDEVALTRFGRPGEFRDGPVEINVESRSLEEPDEPDPFEAINPMALGAAMAQTEGQEPEDEEDDAKEQA